MEMHDARSPDERRLEARVKVTQAFKRVSGVAKGAGVKRHGLFNDARYRGLYKGLGNQAVLRRKGLKEKDNLFDHAGALELSAHEFQMNLAADVIAKDRTEDEQRAIETNQRVGEHVRGTIEKSGGTMPEDLPLEEPIKAVAKRLKGHKKLGRPSGSST
jgi:DNA-damage-inducible protein D